MNEDEKHDRQMTELLNELRIALPGVQILFGFLLTVPFSAGFKSVDSTQRGLLYATLVATTASTICLIAPSATHRLRFGQGDRRYIIKSANRYLIAGLVWLGLAMVLGITLITDVLYNGALVVVLPTLIAVAIAFFWFIRPLRRNESSGP